MNEKKRWAHPPISLAFRLDKEYTEQICEGFIRNGDDNERSQVMKAIVSISSEHEKRSLSQ